MPRSRRGCPQKRHYRKKSRPAEGLAQQVRALNLNQKLPQPPLGPQLLLQARLEHLVAPSAYQYGPKHQPNLPEAHAPAPEENQSLYHAALSQHHAPKPDAQTVQ